MLPTKHIHVFRAVCQEGTVTGAAEVLRRTQSSVSRLVREIEERLGVQLFERHGRGMLLTEFGKALLHRVDRAFAELETARQILSDQTEEARTTRSPPMFALAVNELRLDVLQAFSVRSRVNAVARQLGVSQPAVSLAMRDIEAAAGFPVFSRNVMGMSLSPEGEVLLLHLRRALSELRVAYAELAAMEGRMEGTVRVGTLPFARPFMLPVAVSHLLAAYPGLHVSTVEGPFETLVAGLLSGDLDFVLGVLRPTELHPELVSEELFVEDMAVFARVGHPLAGTSRVSLEDILRHRWVLAREGTPTRRVIAAVFARAGLPAPRVAVESSDLSFIRGLLVRSDMLTAASRHLFQQEVGDGSLAMLPVALPGTGRGVGILRRTQKHSSPGANRLLEYVRGVRWSSNQDHDLR